MPNPVIEQMFKERLQSDITDNESQLHNLFINDSWKSQPLTTYYGAGPDSGQLVDIAVIRTMGRFCTEYRRQLPNPGKAWLISMIEPKTMVYDGSNKNNALDLMSTAAIHTKPA